MVVESIDQVLSVDLVANPATTTGLFEDDSEGSAANGRPTRDEHTAAMHQINSQAMGEIHSHMNETDGKRTTLAQKRKRIQSVLAAWQDFLNALSPPASGYSAGDTTRESTDMDWKDIDLEGLKKNRPELLTALQESLEKGPPAQRQDDELKTLQEELKALRAEKAGRELQEAIASELKAAGLDPANKAHCSEVFLEDLRATAEPAKRTAKIADRKMLVAQTAAGGHALPGRGPSTGSPLQESAEARVIPPATAPLTQRIARFVK